MTEAKDKERADADRAAVRGQQHTGNHDKPAAERGGSDRRGGTRAGAENVEPADEAFRKVDEKAQVESAKERQRDRGYD